MSSRITRRKFLESSGKTAAGVAAGVAAVNTATRRATGAGALGANKKVVIGLIGAGGQGQHDTRAFCKFPDDVAVVAICDVDDEHLDHAAGWLKKDFGHDVERYKDHRKLLDRKDIDLVIVGTPDHWHAIVAIDACQAGKHVYVEKPCSHRIKEGRAMVEAARKHNKLMQVGMQQRSDPHFIEATQYVRDGHLGQITCTRSVNFGNEHPMPDNKDGPAPAGVDYDRWLGPAPVKPFNRNRFHGTFRWFFDYAAGMIGDWNVHLQDITHWGMDVIAPKAVATSGGKYVLNDNRDTPDTMEVIYDYEKDGHRWVHIYSMRKVTGRGIDGRGYGNFFYGTNGMLYISRGGWEVFPEHDRVPDPNDSSKRIDKPRTPAVKKPGDDRVDRHARNLLDAIQNGGTYKDLHCDIETGHRTATVCHLGNIAMWVGRKIYWDAENEIITDRNGRIDSEATALLTKQYRAPYRFPAA